ncbi:MAG TPA: tetratricopeptide repeat protein [Candidatus Melainabacteria bacterium]|nr:tetratricopeptide repeat protein [Candidatus Melainabacteria bacterium]
MRGRICLHLMVSMIVALLQSSVTPEARANVFSKKPVVDSRQWKQELIQGEAYLRTKELENAEICFESAYRLIRRDRSSTAFELVTVMESLAKAQYMQEKLEESLRLYRKALAILEKHEGKANIALVPTLNIIGGVYENEGDFKKAEKYYLRALEISERVEGNKSLTAASCRHKLGRIYFLEEKPLEAEEAFYKTLVAVLGPEDPKATKTSLPGLSSAFLEELLSDYIDLIFKSDLPSKVLQSRFQGELLKDELDLLVRRKGVAPSAFSKEVSYRISPGSLSSGSTDDTDSKAAFDQSGDSAIVPARKPADLVALEKINRQRVLFYERMIEVDIKSLGRNHPSVARDLTGLANIYLSQRRYEDAKPLLQRALKIYQDTYEADSQLVKQTRLLLQLISEEESPSVDYHFVSLAGELPSIPLPAQSLDTAFRLNELAFQCYCQGRVERARKLYEYALAATVAASGEESPLSAACMADLSRLMRLTGRIDKAERLENNARAIWRKKLQEKRAQLLP